MRAKLNHNYLGSIETRPRTNKGPVFPDNAKSLESEKPMSSIRSDLATLGKRKKKEVCGI